MVGMQVFFFMFSLTEMTGSTDNLERQAGRQWPNQRPPNLP